MISNTMKRCPFCGNVPKTAINYSRCGSGELQLRFSVICSQCGVSKHITKEVEGKSFDDYIKIMNEVMDLWNKRVNE